MIPLPVGLIKRIGKWLAFIVLGLVISSGIAVVILERYKTEIITSVTKRFQESMNGKLSVGTYQFSFFHSFPAISITLCDVVLYGPDWQPHHPAFLEVARIDINVQPLRLFQKKISIRSLDAENGQISIFKTRAGYTNLDVFMAVEKKSSTPRPNVLLDLKKIRLRNVMVSYKDSSKMKDFDAHLVDTDNSVTSTDTTISLHLGGYIEMLGLSLNAHQGRYLKSKNVYIDLSMTLMSGEKILLVTPSVLKFPVSTVHVSGEFHWGVGRFRLAIQSDKMDFEEGLSILEDTLSRKLRRYQIEKPLDLKVSVLQPKRGSPPAVDVAFSFSDSHATVGKLTMDDMSITGHFSNHLDSTQRFDDLNSGVELTKIQGDLNELPMTGRAVLTNLVDPTLQLDATFETDLKWLNLHLDTTQLRMTGGHFTSSFSYSGKLSEYLDENRSKYQGQLSGKASISKGRFQYLPRNVTIDNLNATFLFTESRFEIEKMALRLNKSPLYFRGNMTDFVPFFTTLGGNGKVTLDFHAPKMDLSQIVQHTPVKKTIASKTESRKRITAMVERLSRDLEFDVNFTIKEFLNKDFKASHAKGRLILGNNKLVLRDAQMEFADGTVGLNLNLTRLQADISPFELEAKLQNVDLKEFFHSFRDFNQTTMRSEHIHGRVNMNIKLNAELNNHMEVLTPQLQGQATFSLHDGKLTNFEPMQKLSNFLFKGRDFSHVQFGQINANIGLRGTAIDVQRMEIQSTALTMFIEGKYDLLGHSDLSIQVPLSNLQKRDQYFAPENIGVDAKVGASVFLRVHPDKNGETTITFDPFKKFRKK